MFGFQCDVPVRCFGWRVAVYLPKVAVGRSPASLHTKNPEPLQALSLSQIRFKGVGLKPEIPKPQFKLQTRYGKAPISNLNLLHPTVIAQIISNLIPCRVRL